MGKRPATPQSAEVKRARLQLTEACKEKAIDRVLEIIHECEHSDLVLPNSALAQALSALAAANEGGAEQPRSVLEATRAQHFRHAQRMFERARVASEDWGGQGDSIYTLMVRMASRAGELAAAMRYLREMRQPPLSIRPKLRTFVPILEACASAGLTTEAEELYREHVLPSCAATEASAIWTSEDEDRLWQCIFALRLRAWSGAAAGVECDARRRGLNTILQDIASICPQLRCDSGITDALQDVFQVLQWHTTLGVQIPTDAKCPVTSKCLRSIQPSKADLRSLRSLIERLAIENASQRKLDDWARFISWLDQEDHQWDTVIDGANIAHANQNFGNGAFSHRQIDELVTQCNEVGRRKVAVVLRGRWLSPKTDLALPMVKPKKRSMQPLGAALEKDVADQKSSRQEPAEVDGRAQGVDEDWDVSFTDTLSESQRRVVEFGQKWKEQDILVVAPPSINDDWIALYIAVEMCLRGVQDVQFVSNDELRDHFWRMGQPLAFRTWRQHHSTRFAISCEHPTSGAELADVSGEMNVQLFPPPLYSHCAQQSLDGQCWHFPVRPKDKLVAQDAAEAGSAEVKETTREPQLEWLVAYEPDERQHARALN